MFVVQTLLWLKKRSDSRKTGCTAWHGCEKRLWVESCFCTFLFMVFFLYSFRLSLSAILYKLSFPRLPDVLRFSASPYSAERGSHLKAWIVGPGDRRSGTLRAPFSPPRPPGTHILSGSLWIYLGQLCQGLHHRLPAIEEDLPSSFIPWWFFFSFGSAFFKICSLHFSSLRGIRRRPSAAGKAASTQRGGLDDSEGASFGATVGSGDSPQRGRAHSQVWKQPF